MGRLARDAYIHTTLQISLKTSISAVQFDATKKNPEVQQLVYKFATNLDPEATNAK